MAELSGASMLNDEYDTSSRVYKKYSESMRKPAIVLGRDAKFAFGWNISNLRLIGLWPEQSCNDRLITKYSSLIWCFLLFSFLVAPQALAPITITLVPNEMMDLISTGGGSALGFIKIIVIWYNGEVLAGCLLFVSDDWTRKITTEERETMMKIARLGRNISIGNTIFVHCLELCYLNMKTVPLLYLMFNAQNATDLSKYLIYPGYFPFDTNNLSNFVFVVCGQCVSCISCTLAYSGTDGLIAILIVHLCGQIAILRHDIVNLIDDDESLSYEHFREKLRVIVKRHHTLIRVGTMIKDTVHFMLLFLILTCIVQLCCQLFRLVSVVTDRKPGQFPYIQVLFYISYLNASFIHLLLYCYIGDMLINESESLELASYSCKWYNVSGRNANDLMLVMNRAKAPLQIWAGKFVPFSLELFGNALKTSISYFSVLLTMKERLSD